MCTYVIRIVAKNRLGKKIHELHILVLMIAIGTGLRLRLPPGLE